MEGASEEIALAVEIIRQLENLEYPEDSILQAMILVCKDTLQKLPEDRRIFWQQTLSKAFASEDIIGRLN